MARIISIPSEQRYQRLSRTGKDILDTKKERTGVRQFGGEWRYLTGVVNKLARKYDVNS